MQQKTEFWAYILMCTLDSHIKTTGMTENKVIWQRHIVLDCVQNMLK